MQDKGKYIWILIAAVLMLTGIQNGESHVVLQKAVNICLECIGIG